MQDPTARLMEEHRVIEKVLAALETAGRAKLPWRFYERAIEFIARYADGCHHAKEEGAYFPAMEERGLPRDGGPIGVMLYEHEEGRAHVRRMREFLSRGEHDALRKESLAYAALLRAHIAKEDNVLFPIGRELLTEEDGARLRRAFAEVDGPACREWERVADELLQEAGAAS